MKQKDGAKTTNQRTEAAMPSLREWLKDPKVLLLISVALNAAFAAIIAIIASDKDIQIETPYFVLAKLGLNGHVEALFKKGTDLPQVRALVARLRDMSREEKGPFKSAEHQARIVAKNNRDGVSEGIAQVCSDSGFEDMYLTIWSNDKGGGGTTVHAATEKECPPSLSRDLVELHAQDWKRVFGRSGGPRVESVLVRLHPPRITPPPAHPQVAQASALLH